MIHSDEKWEQLPGEKRIARWGSVVWKRGVPQKELEMHGMKKKRVKFTLRSAERGGVQEYGMKLRTVERRGCQSAEWNWGTPKEGGLRSAEWNRGEPIQAPMGLRSAYPREGALKMGWGKESGMYYRSAGRNWRAHIPGWAARIGGSRVRNGTEERWEEELIAEWNRRGSI